MAPWIKKEVQRHARVAASVELYTIPFYTTVMTSVIDENSDAYNIIRGVLIEEMMHLQLAANLCVALDTTPSFQFPSYDIPVWFLNPGAVLDVNMGPLDSNSLSAMLAIETPESTLGAKDITPNGNNSPTYPYSSIGEMYHALLFGIKEVNQFSWTAKNQQERWAAQGYPQIIRSINDAEEAVKAIEAQGEGGMISPGFLVEPEKYQMNNTVPSGAPGAPYKASPILHKELSHYGRFLKIKRAGLPPVYAGIENATHSTNKVLQRKFAAMMSNLNVLWGGGTVIPQDALWLNTLETMRESAQAARECWEAGVIPNWMHFELPS
uniref:ferritin-like domain-containing protein n=1 Tax=Candidatus Electronema sp. TaxID=2698783 RepID=UPI004056A85B